MNKVILVGNLVENPQIRVSQSGVKCANIRLAVQRSYINKSTGVRDADFFNLVAWRGNADFCEKYLTKGQKFGFVGTLQSRSYDADDGTKRYITEVVVDEIEFITPKRDSQPQTAPVPNDAPTSEVDIFEEVTDDELPF